MTERYDGYTEIHHIIPRCVGGDDSKDNLVKLSAREHFICHILLTKIYKNTKDYFKLLNAAIYMGSVNNLNEGRYINSRLYKTVREEFSMMQKIGQNKRW